VFGQVSCCVVVLCSLQSELTVDVVYRVIVFYFLYLCQTLLAVVSIGVGACSNSIIY
jgi:hypothetical protein